ncbi:hypothetical protein TWF281_008055 [Arthrobotrys megalospora]
MSAITPTAATSAQILLKGATGTPSVKLAREFFLQSLDGEIPFVTLLQRYLSQYGNTCEARQTFHECVCDFIGLGELVGLYAQKYEKGLQKMEEEEEIDKLTQKMGMLVLRDKKNIQALKAKAKLRYNTLGSSKMMIIVKSKSQRQALKVTASKNAGARKERKKINRLSQKLSA